MTKFNIFIISLCLLLSTRAYVGAFDDKATHPKITEAAIQLKSSTLDRFIQDNLGYADGINLGVQWINQVDYIDSETKKEVKKGVITTLSVSSWIQEGATAEDTPKCRAASHFHNPLKSWGQSGSYSSSPIDDLYTWGQLKYCGPENIYSAITWATGFTSKEDEEAGKEVQFANPIFTEDPTRAPNNWSNARDKYYKAFTELKEDSRDAYLAGSLVSLGQVVHLLEDIGDQYTGQNPSSATNIGLAEFSNANYFSDYTIPSDSPTVDHQFPNPKIDNSYHICEEPLALGIERRYVSRKEDA